MKKRSDVFFEWFLCIFIFIVGFNITHKMLISLAAPFILAIIFIGSYIIEIKADKKADKLANMSITEQSEALLTYKLQHDFAKLKGDSLISDQKRRLRSPIVFVFLFSSIALLLIVFAFIRKISLFATICGIFLAILSFVFSLRGLLTIPLKKYIILHKNDFDDVNNDYLNGNMIVYGEHGINIGSKYITMFNSAKINSVRINDITNAYCIQRRVKHKTNGLYVGEKLYHYIAVNTASGEHYEVNLNEYQAQIALEEIERTGALDIKSERIANVLETDTSNNIFTP